VATLARVTDPKALAADEGARARLAVKVPEAWIASGAEIAVTAPRLLSCDRCGGGGCDGCDRSGALRAPHDEGARTIVVRLPGRMPGKEALRLRLPAPFDDGAIAQLILTVNVAPEPDERVRRLDLAPVRPAPSAHLWWLAAIASAVAVAWLLW